MTGNHYTVATAAQLRGTDTGELQTNAAVKTDLTNAPKVTVEDAEGEGTADHTDLRASIASLRDSELEVQMAGEMTIKPAKAQLTLPSSKIESSAPAQDRMSRNSPVTDIYFSPLDLNRSHIALSSPLNSPLTTPTQASYNASQISLADSSSQASTFGDQGELRLGSDQIDHLVGALVDAPLIQQHVKRHLKRKEEANAQPEPSVKQNENAPTVASTKSEAALTDGQSASSFYSHPNTPFCADSSSPGVQTSEEEHASTSPSPKAKAFCQSHEDQSQPTTTDTQLQSMYATVFGDQFDTQKAPQARLLGIRVADPKIEGCPVSLLSKGFEPSCDKVNVGMCTHIQLPRGAPIDRALRVVPRAQGVQATVTLQLVVQALRCQTEKPNKLVVVDIDMTDSCTKAALMELLRVGLSTQATSSEDTLEVNTLVQTATEAFTALDNETCTMQTLTLLSDIDRITSQFMDFYIVRAKAMHDTGYPARLTVPYISHHLHKIMSEKDAKDLQVLIVGIVGKKSIKGEPVTSKVEWDGVAKRIRVVPLIDRSEGPAMAWVCFARDGFAIGDW